MMPRPPRWFLAALSGALLALAFPGSGDQPWLAFAALVPLLVAIEGLGWRRAGVLGFLSGIIFWLAVIPWVVPTMIHYGDVPWPLAGLVLLALAGYLALYTTAFSALLARTAPRSSAAYVIAAASLWVALEFLRTHLFTGFPWNLLGYSQYRNLSLIQVAAVTGVYGVSFAVAAINAGLARLVHLQYGRKDRLGGLGVAAAVVGLAVGSGWLLSPARAENPAIPVALVQGNIDQGVKWDPAYQAATLDVYRRLTLEAARGGAQLIVWPETAMPFFVREDPRWREVENLARVTGAYLLVGALDRSLGEPRNSAFLVGPDGQVRGRYDKRHLVPFGEYVPLQRFLFFVDVIAGGAIGAFAPGAEATTFSTPAGRVGVVICYEAIFPAEVREFFRGGADVLVNITNDAWFGRSAAPVQHLAMATFRAVENRAYLVRAANSGISAVVAPDGRIVEASGLFTRRVLSGTVTPRAGATLYTRTGDLFAWATVGISLAAVWPVPFITRRRTVRSLQRTVVALENQDGRVRVRRSVLASLIAGAGAVAAGLWGWRRRSADGRGYHEVARWKIPGGEGRFVAVGPEQSAEELRAVGDRLREEFGSLENGVVMIFDDPEAAREVRKGSRRIGEERFQAALRHQRAMYMKQPARGEHRLVIYSSYPAINGEIDY